MSQAKSYGFTLIEVLVALVIISGSFLALLQSAGVFTRQSQQLIEKTLALWALQNELATIQSEFPPIGKKEGRATQGHLNFKWELRVEGTEVAKIRKGTLSVYPENQDERRLIELTHFFLQP